MSFDNSFDADDLYRGSGEERNYYDDIVDIRELPDLNRQVEYSDRPGRKSTWRGTDMSEIPLSYIEREGRTALEETFGDDDDATPQSNTDDSQGSESKSSPSFRLYRTDMRENHWF